MTWSVDLPRVIKTKEEVSEPSLSSHELNESATFGKNLKERDIKAGLFVHNNLFYFP